MSVAFPALLILLLVLPGIILRYTYLRGFWPRSPFVFSSVTDEIAYGLVGALLLHAVWVRLLTLLGFHIHLAPLILLLLGTFGPDQRLLGPTVGAVAGHPYHLCEYFLSLYAFAALLGLLFHALVRYGRLDRRFRPLRFKNDWYYLIRGELFDFPENRAQGIDPDFIAGVYLSTVITQGDRTYLYRGIVGDWFFDRDGNLDRVVLTSARRRELGQDRTGQFQDDPEHRYYPIRGTYLVIRYAEMQTVNFEYITVEIQTTDDFPDDAIDPATED